MSVVRPWLHMDTLKGKTIILLITGKKKLYGQIRGHGKEMKNCCLL